MSLKQKQYGYIALLSVLIVGAATTAIGLTLLATGTDSQRSVLITQQSVQARQSAAACAEEALQKVHDLKTFTGTGTLTTGAASCSYTVTSTGTSTISIATTGTSGSTVRKNLVYATINASSITVNSWQDAS